MAKGPKKSNLVTMSFWLDRDHVALMKRAAAAEERTMGAWLRRLLASALETPRKEAQ